MALMTGLSRRSGTGLHHGQKVTFDEAAGPVSVPIRRVFFSLSGFRHIPLPSFAWHSLFGSLPRRGGPRGDFIGVS